VTLGHSRQCPRRRRDKSEHRDTRRVPGVATCSRPDPALLGRAEHAPLDVIREHAPELGEHSAWVGDGARAPDIRYLVIPPRPASSAGMSEEQLTALVTRDSMIGVPQPTADRKIRFGLNGNRLNPACGNTAGNLATENR